MQVAMELSKKEMESQRPKEDSQRRNKSVDKKSDARAATRKTEQF